MFAAVGTAIPSRTISVWEHVRALVAAQSEHKRHRESKWEARLRGANGPLARMQRFSSEGGKRRDG